MVDLLFLSSLIEFIALEWEMLTIPLLLPSRFVNAKRHGWLVRIVNVEMEYRVGRMCGGRLVMAEHKSRVTWQVVHSQVWRMDHPWCKIHFCKETAIWIQSIIVHAKMEKYDIHGIVCLAHLRDETCKGDKDTARSTPPTLWKPCYFFAHHPLFSISIHCECAM